MFARLRLIDRSLLFVLLLSVFVVVPRSAIIASFHSESLDDEYHLVRGVRFLKGTLGRTPLNDPVLGAAVMALPLYAVEAQPNRDTRSGLILHGQRVGPEALQMMVAVWKSLLFVPGVLLAFVWVRRIYNERAAWVAVALLLIEPTISAHVAPAALDVLGFEMILLASFCWWRYFAKPGWLRLLLAAAVSPAAMLTKHTAIIVPIVAAIYAVVWWVGRPTGEPRGPWLRRQLLHVAVAVVIALVVLTILAGGFEPVRRPESISESSVLARLFEHRLPAGYYWRSLQTALHHGGEGHPSWLLGQRNDAGSWMYYPVVAFYKVPIAIALLLVAGVGSLFVVRPRFEEWALLVPMVLLAALITTGGINIGFRHAIPAYALLLLLATRVLLIERRRVAVAVAALLAVTVIDVLRYGPDLISYINRREPRVWMQINDSNLDWGQGLKQIRTWIDSHPRQTRGRRVYVRYFGLDYAPNVEYYLGGRAARVPRGAGPPPGGLLIISPVYLAGMFETPAGKPGLYDFLRDEKPVDVIGHGSNLVYDLDAVYRKQKRTTQPATTQAATTQAATTQPATTQAETTQAGTTQAAGDLSPP